MSRFNALYIHVPFCRLKCSYCSFVSFPNRESDIEAYTDALCIEMERRLCGRELKSIFLGGGTPSLLSLAEMGRVLGSILRHAGVAPDAEVSLEANPGTINYVYLKGLRKLGFNRLSLGVQSFDGKELKQLGRIHSVQEAVAAYNDARRAGFDNINLDLIYGLPGQTAGEWRRTLEKALELSPQHLSLYALSIEEGTPLHFAVDSGTMETPDADLAAEMYEHAEKVLAEAGYRHYEISNWARPGFECRHNLVYCHNEDYLGVGVAAHSLLDGHRIANTRDLDEYIRAYLAGSTPAPALDEEIDAETRLSESVILALRLDEGADIQKLDTVFGTDILDQYHAPIEDMKQAGLLEITGNRLKLTPRGRLLSNEVFWRLLPEKAAAQ